ncbi:MAG TPA: HEPN domain-containing protein [Egibacteraceae bacterium]|nr:HEPN domain-containing protein [Egibacteraceae bacterium]
MRDPRREGLRWLRQAEADLEAARLLRERLAALACFHAQQAAEKALKAVLYAAGERVVLRHSLGALGEAVNQQSPGYEPLRGEVAKLDRFPPGTRTRCHRVPTRPRPSIPPTPRQRSTRRRTPSTTPTGT